jgi:tetrahydromethanopterin S-methyltransferase subunit B
MSGKDVIAAKEGIDRLQKQANTLRSSIKPEAGDYITFPGNRHYQHGVKEVSGAVRYTLSTWVRFEDAYGKEMYSHGIEK